MLRRVCLHKLTGVGGLWLDYELSLEVRGGKNGVARKRYQRSQYGPGQYVMSNDEAFYANEV